MSDNETPLDSRGRLLVKLKECELNYDHEVAHFEADDALLEFINDSEITEAFNRIDKWYA